MELIDAVAAAVERACPEPPSAEQPAATASSDWLDLDAIAGEAKDHLKPQMRSHFHTLLVWLLKSGRLSVLKCFFLR